LDFFQSDLPENVPGVDGMGAENYDDDEPSATTRNTSRRGSVGGSFDADDPLERLTQFFEDNATSSPQKEEYFRARTEQVKFETDRERKRQKYGDISARLEAAGTCAATLASVSSNINAVCSNMEGTEQEEEAKKGAAALWDVVQEEQRKLVELVRADKEVLADGE
jgi:hypothetical protein